MHQAPVAFLNNAYYNNKMQDFQIIVLKPERDQAVRNRHPWIFSGAIMKLPKDIKNGDIAVVMSHDGKQLGYCHYHGQSTIAARMFYFGNEPMVIDRAFWFSKLETAVEYRRQMGLINNPLITGYRLLYAEGDELPGVICDVFEDVAVLQLSTAGARQLQKTWVDYLTHHMGIKHVYHKSLQANTESGWLVGDKPEVVFVENGKRLMAQVASGQKTGFFLDQRDNRLLVQQYAQGKHVLDAFCYSGGFSVSALVGGAKQVTSVDISADAIRLTMRNAEDNGGHGRHEGVTQDCFDYLRQMPENKFDLIVLDPPAFAKNAHAIGQAAKGYKDINLQAFKRIAKGGLLFTFSCSQHISKDLFRKIVFSAAADAGRSVRIVHQLGQPLDHPINIFHPEGEYLKGLMLYVV